MGDCIFTIDDVNRLLASASPGDANVLFVHDDGVYLMIQGKPKPNPIIYAKGCDPQKDEDQWENSRRLVGGDDFGETFALADLRKAVTGRPNIIEVVFAVTPKTISIKTVSMGKRPARK